MAFAVWFGVVVGTAALAGLSVGYFHHDKDRRKQMIAALIGMLIWYVLALSLPEWQGFTVMIGQLAWAILVALGYWLGRKLRESIDARDPFVQHHSSWGD